VKEIIELEIQDVAFGGAGVGRHEGVVVFVPFTAPGDRIRARVLRGKKKFIEAELVEVLQPAPTRVTPPCAYFGRCGGCAYQHIAYPQQLQIKQAQVEQTLRRVGRLETVPMQPIIPSPQQYGFRNRIRVHVKDRQAGFFAHRSHDLVPIARCEIAQPAVNESLHGLRRAGPRDGDYVVAGSNRGQFFEQTNDGVAGEMLRLVESWIGVGQRTLVDAYSGAGFFAHRLADKFEQVVGIEENEHAVAHARRRAGEKESYLAGDVAVLLGDVLAQSPPDATTLILDPPAAGLSPRVVEMILYTPPKEIIYVSCDPATMARDLALLTKTYRLEAVRPLDMFPQTAEIEVAARLRL
jgi:23S rRNA (uracil1939-C5)-methyltransferase